MKNKFIFFTILVISLFGVILLIAGYRLGANVGMVINSMKDWCIETYQWVSR